MLAVHRAPRILVIRGGAIGDFILTLPAIRLVREAFPAAHLEILGYSQIVRLAEHRGYADAIRSIEYGPLAAFFAKNGELPEDLCRYFAGFQQVISYLFDPDEIFADNLKRAGVRNFLHVSPRIGDHEHAAIQLAQPLVRLALFLDDPAPVIAPLPSDAAEAERLLGPLPAEFIALHPGSGAERKNWPLDRWQLLIERLLALPSEPTLLLVGGEADTDRVGALVAALPSARIRPAIDLALPALAAALSRARWFVGHDSGISHLAAATEIPCTLLFGPTDPEVWAPRNRGVRVIRAPDGDLASIGVDPAVATAPANG
jgi:heptosyltransferase-2